MFWRDEEPDNSVTNSDLKKEQKEKDDAKAGRNKLDFSTLDRTFSTEKTNTPETPDPTDCGSFGKKNDTKTEFGRGGKIGNHTILTSKTLRK